MKAKPNSWPRVDAGLLLILALPLGLLASGLNWLYDYVTGMDFIDPWIYWGFALDLPAHLRAFPSTYYGSRLSWIIPGFLVHKLFSPFLAGYVLHLSLFYAAVIPFYLTLKRTFGQRTALLSAIFMGTYGYFLWAVGWDYVDGPGIAYFLLTVFALTNAADKRPSWFWPVLAGFTYGGMIYSHLFLVVFTPPLLLYYILKRHGTRGSLWVDSVFFASGLLLCSVALGWINYDLGGDFLFYGPSVQAATNLASSRNPYKLATETWWGSATWLVLPAWLLTSSIALLFAMRKGLSDIRNRLRLPFLATYLLCAAIMILYDLRGGSSLQLTYYASFLIPGAFLALGAQIDAITERLTTSQFLIMIGSAVVFLPLACKITTGSPIVQAIASNARWLIVGSAVAGISLFFVKTAWIQPASLAVVFVALGLVNAASASHRAPRAESSALGFQAIVDSVQAVRDLEPRGRVLFWYRLAEPWGNYYRSIASTYLWGFSLFNEDFPSLERIPDASQLPSVGRTVIVLTTNPDALQRASDAMSEIGFQSQRIAERRIEKGPYAWNLLFLRLHQWPVLESVTLDPNHWPRRVELRQKSKARDVLSLEEPASYFLFRSDLNNASEWQVNRYGQSGGLRIQSDCLANGDTCGLYSSGDGRDHLASPFAALSAPGGHSVFFSLWIKPEVNSELPVVRLQDERFNTLAECEELASAPGGWILCGGWAGTRDATQVRITVTPSRGSSDLLDKAMLLQPAGPLN